MEYHRKEASIGLNKIKQRNLDKIYWEKAVRLNTQNSYEQYLVYSNMGMHTKDALHKISEIKRDKNFWTRVKIKNTKEAYQGYLNNFPNGIFNKEALLLINQL